MFLIVFLLMFIRFSMLFKSFLVNITSDESIAISVPLFTLTPMLLLASAGLSFIPSPHIITYLPSVFSFTGICLNNPFTEVLWLLSLVYPSMSTNSFNLFSHLIESLAGYEIYLLNFILPFKMMEALLYCLHHQSS